MHKHLMLAHQRSHQPPPPLPPPSPTHPLPLQPSRIPHPPLQLRQAPLVFLQLWPRASVVNGLSRHCVSPVWTIAMVRKLNKIPLDTRQPQSYFYILIHSVFFNPSFLIFSELIFTLHLSHPREKHNEDGKRFAIGFCWVGVGFS